MVDWCVSVSVSTRRLPWFEAPSCLCGADTGENAPRSTPYAGEITPDFLLKAALGSVNKALDG